MDREDKLEETIAELEADLAKCQREQDVLADTCKKAFEFLSSYFSIIEYEELEIAKTMGFTELMNRLALTMIDKEIDDG